MSAVDTLPPVALEEIAERAALMTRVDRKYLVPREDVEALITGSPAELRALEIDGRRRQAYLSLYYDTEDLAAYRAAATGRRRRWKVRRRVYVDSGASFLEVKTRTGRGESAKLRIALPSDSPTLLQPVRRVDSVYLGHPGPSGVSGVTRTLTVRPREEPT